MGQCELSRVSSCVTAVLADGYSCAQGLGEEPCSVWLSTWQPPITAGAGNGALLGWVSSCCTSECWAHILGGKGTLVSQP